MNSIGKRSFARLAEKEAMFKATSKLAATGAALKRLYRTNS